MTGSINNNILITISIVYFTHSLIHSLTHSLIVPNDSINDCALDDNEASKGLGYFNKLITSESVTDTVQLDTYGNIVSMPYSQCKNE